MTDVEYQSESQSNARTIEFSNVLGKVTAQLEAGEAVDWVKLQLEYPQFKTELEQVGPALERLLTLGNSISNADGDDSAGKGDVADFDVDAGPTDVGPDNRQQRVGGQRGRFVDLRPCDFGCRHLLSSP